MKTHSRYAEGIPNVSLGADFKSLLKATRSRRDCGPSTVTVKLTFDTAQLQKQLKAVAKPLSVLPKPARKLALDEFQRLLSCDRFFKLDELRNVSARGASEVIFRPRILRPRELITAALRAAKHKSFCVHRRAPVCVKGLRKSKASTGRSVS